MKSIIYKYRIISAILFCFLILLLGTYLQDHKAFYFIWVAIPISVILNRKILGDGADLSNKEKMLLIVSVLVMAGVFLFLNYNMAVNKIINK